MSHVRQIAREPHPSGTAANEAVRHYLMSQLRGLGLAPEIQSGLGIASRSKTAGLVHNVLVRLPGTRPGAALMLVAHYDSAPNSFGAADNGASVAAMLETLRALKNLPPLQNDVIFLFTDGEETGLLGAELFVAWHPWAKSVATVLNFEYRGNSGPVWMFETSQGNDKLVQAWSRALPHALGNSLMYEIYRYMPNGTDMGVFKRAGLAGLNFAAIEGHTRYHTALDRSDLLDQATLQQQGDTMLAMTRAFGQQRLNGAGVSDRIYFNVPSLGLVSYPAHWSRPILALVVLLSGAWIVFGRRRGVMRTRQLSLAVVVFILLAACIAALCQAIWAAVVMAHPAYRSMLQGDTYNSHWYLPAFVALALALFTAAYNFLRRWFSTHELAGGAIVCWLLLLIVSTFLLPGVTFLLTWPLIAVLVTQLFLMAPRPQSWSTNSQAFVLACGTIPALLIVTPIVQLIFSALSVSMVFVPVVLTVLLFGVASPLLLGLNERMTLPWVALGISCACFAGGAVTAGFDAAHPRPVSLFYATNGDTGQAMWLSADGQTDAWTGAYFKHNAERRAVPELLGDGSERFWVSPAPRQPVAVPVLTVLEDRTVGKQRRLIVQLTSPRTAPRVKLAVTGTRVLGSQIDGVVLSQTPELAWRARLIGFGAQPVRIGLTVPAAARFQLRVVDVSYGLAGVGVPPYPAGLLAQPFGQSNTIQAWRTLAFEPSH